MIFLYEAVQDKINRKTFLLKTLLRLHDNDMIIWLYGNKLNINFNTDVILNINFEVRVVINNCILSYLDFLININKHKHCSTLFLDRTCY